MNAAPGKLHQRFLCIRKVGRAPKLALTLTATLNAARAFD
jgi:hypothetical protein